MALTLPTLSNIKLSFTSRSEAQAAYLPVGVEYILVNGLMYKKDSSGTALTTADGDKWSPHGFITIQHWAENTTPGTTDMSSAVQAAIEYASSKAGAITTGSGWSVKVSGMGETLALGSTVDFDGLTGVEVYDAKFISLAAIGTANPAFSITAASGTRPRFIRFSNVFMECNRLSSGFLFDNADKCHMTDVFIHGQTGYGIRSTTKNGEFVCTRVSIKEWDWGETGFDDRTNRVAKGFDMNTADFILESCVANYCDIPFYKGVGYNWQVNNCHFYNSFLTGTFDPDTVYNMYIDGPEGGVITNLYNDNGVIFINADGMGSTNAYPLTLQLSGVNHVISADGDNTANIIFTTSEADNDLVGLTMVNHTFPVIGSNIKFQTTGSGSYTTDLRWVFVGLNQLDGTPVSGVTDVLNVGDRVRANSSGVMTLGKFSNGEIRSDRNVILNADYNNDSGSPESEVIFKTDNAERVKINASGLLITNAKTPSSASDLGNTGQIAWDSNYVYVCVATDTWKRAAIATW